MIKQAWLLYVLTIVLTFALGISIAKAEELPKELVMKTDVGEVVLTVEECHVVNEHGFAYHAYATEGDIKHNGCWNKDHDIVNIWFYEEPKDLVATYRDYHFKPRPNM
jgi:hypothetical protein